MDDEAEVLDIARQMLSYFEYDVTTASDGNQAIALFKNAHNSSAPFDAVILDLTVPGGMGGVETIRQLRNIDPDVRALVCSGYANDPVMSEHENYGFKAVASKPYDLQRLSRALVKLFS